MDEYKDLTINSRKIVLHNEVKVHGDLIINHSILKGEIDLDEGDGDFDTDGDIIHTYNLEGIPSFILENIMRDRGYTHFRKTV